MLHKYKVQNDKVTKNFKIDKILELPD